MTLKKVFQLTLEFDERTRWLSSDAELTALLAAISRTVGRVNTQGAEPAVRVDEVIPEEKVFEADDLCGIGMHSWKRTRDGRQCSLCGLVWHSTRRAA